MTPTPAQIADACRMALHAAEIKDVAVTLRTLGDGPDDWAVDLGEFGASIRPQKCGLSVFSYWIIPPSWDPRTGAPEPEKIEEINRITYTDAGDAVRDAVLRVIASKVDAAESALKSIVRGWEIPG